ncbi:MAG: DUF2300 domain-containing protein [Desulfobulbus sp.]|nr:DUF2300 domain-containing protein [Desulfobulbus sp.]
MAGSTMTAMRFFWRLVVSRLCLVAGFALLLAGIVQAGEPPALSVLWRDGQNGALHWRLFDDEQRDISASAQPPAQTPLGSLWKLFVFTWLSENQIKVPDYVCAAEQTDIAVALRREENAYCCPPGGAIGMEAALVRSCGLFFAPERLRNAGDATDNPAAQLIPENWRRFWQRQPHPPPWLLDVTMMRPDTLVAPESIIRALTAIPPRAREQAANVLLARVVDGNREPESAAGVARHLGGQLRVKTFSWHPPGDTDKKYGGGAGWLVDGRPVWFAGFASGQEVMARYGQTLARALAQSRPEQRANLGAPGCVLVHLFARYPLLRVEKPGGEQVADGPLTGRFVAVFAGRGAALPFFSEGEISLMTANGVPKLTARLGLDEYVARVIDREADGRETEAARALAVVIRSYLIHSATSQGNCLVIDDSSRRQRVSPSPPSDAARGAAAFTTGLVLDGFAQYHFDQSGEDRLAWTEAVAMGRAKIPWDAMLKKAYPRFVLRAMYDPVGIPCEAMPEAEQWLARAVSRWKPRLYAELPGFEPPEELPQVCRLASGSPFSEQDRGRIHLREFKGAEDQVTLAHEYLHLGLSHHPAGQDEALVERWARRLTLEMN